MGPERGHLASVLSADVQGPETVIGTYRKCRSYNVFRQTAGGKEEPGKFTLG